MNVALTYSGLATLGVAPAVLADLPLAFSQSMIERAPQMLGDIEDSAPQHWDAHLGTGDAHSLVAIYGTNAANRDAAVANVEAIAATYGLQVVHSQDGAALEKMREHFGWADGFGQPSINGVGESRPGQGTPLKDGGWADLEAGEFIHGYPDEDGQVIKGPAAGLLRNGTFMVYRKLYQDVAAFRLKLQLDAQLFAQNVPLDPSLDQEQILELVAAKIVGRWRDGVAIEIAPRRDTIGSLVDQADAEPDNNFRYRDDRIGLICPRGAHIRRTNPRDALGWDGSMSRRHRIVRRGMPYGKPLTESADDGEDRGLIFICFNADLERQFEFIQSQWCNDGNAFGLGAEKDYLLGDNEGDAIATIQGNPPHKMRVPPDIVLTRGSEYLLMPGIHVLRQLAGV